MSIANKHTTIAENELKVYAVGYAKGKAEGGGGSYDQGHADGEIAEYDRFWDIYQQNGNRIRYEYAFAGPGWTDETFKPKYNICFSDGYAASNMFQLANITDLKKSLADCGVSIDFSQCTLFTHFMGNCASTTLPLVDTRSTTALDYLFSQSTNLVYIDGIILKDDGSQTYAASTFNGLAKTVEIRFSGKFGQSVSFSRSEHLSVDSLQSIVDALKDMTGATAQTLTLHASAGARLTDAQKASIYAKNWTVVY